MKTMDKEFEKFLAAVNSKQAREAQAKMLAEDLGRYADQSGNIPQGDVINASVNASRELTLAILGVYHEHSHSAGR